MPIPGRFLCAPAVRVTLLTLAAVGAAIILKSRISIASSINSRKVARPHSSDKRTHWPPPVRVAIGAYPSRPRCQKLIGWYDDEKGYEQAVALRGVLEHSIAVSMALNDFAYRVLPRSLGAPCRLGFAGEPGLVVGDARDIARMSIDQIKALVTSRLRDMPARSQQLRLTVYSHWDIGCDVAVEVVRLNSTAAQWHTYDAILGQHAGLINAMLDARRCTNHTPFEWAKKFSARHGEEYEVSFSGSFIKLFAVELPVMPFGVEDIRNMFSDEILRRYQTFYQSHLMPELKNAIHKMKRAARRAKAPQHIDFSPMPTEENHPLGKVEYEGYTTVDGIITQLAVAPPSFTRHRYVQRWMVERELEYVTPTIRFEEGASKEYETGDFFGDGYRRMALKHDGDEEIIAMNGLAAVIAECGVRKYELYVENKRKAVAYWDEFPELYAQTHGGKCWWDARREWCNERQVMTPVAIHTPAGQLPSSPWTSPQEDGEIDQAILADPAVLKVVPKRTRSSGDNSQVADAEDQDLFGFARPWTERFFDEYRTAQDAFEQKLNELARGSGQQRTAAPRGTGCGLAAQHQFRLEQQAAQEHIELHGLTFLRDEFAVDRVQDGLDMWVNFKLARQQAAGPPGLSMTRRPTPEDTPSPPMPSFGFAVDQLDNSHGPSAAPGLPPGLAAPSFFEQIKNKKALATVSIDKEVLQPFDTAPGFGGNTQHLASEQTGTTKGFYTTGQQSASSSYFVPLLELQDVQPDPLDTLLNARKQELDAAAEAYHHATTTDQYLEAPKMWFEQ
tara:strand:- start:221 stop:2581 length:2361 start_codon:yes stop_codon:yes gene_type:complete